MAVAVAALVITGSGLTVNVRVWLPVPSVLIAERVMMLVPILVGMPEISPVSGLRLKPTGKSVATKLVGALSAVIV